MKIVGGALKGRRFPAPKGRDTRPTSERVREALGSALQARGAFADARVLDGFAGTGALAFEALSRGAASAVLVEADRRAHKALEASAASLGLGDRVTVRRDDLLASPERLRPLLGLGPFDLVFLDPPYALVEKLGPLLGALEASLTATALLVVERDRRGTLPDHPFRSETSYRYGDTAVDLLSRA